MSTVFKRSGRKGTGSYLVSWYDANGRRHTVSGGADKAAADALARHLDAETMLVKRGVVDPRAQALANAGAVPLLSHLAEYVTAIRGRGRTEQHVAQVEGQCKRLLALCRAERISDLAPARIQAAIAELRLSLSPLTCNHYLHSLKSFTRWLRVEGRTRDDAALAVPPFNAALGPHRERRALSDVEVVKVLRAAQEGPPVAGMSGPDRALLYALALGTGLRRSELASLARASFALDALPPTVTLAAESSKRRRVDVLPLPASLVPALRSHLDSLPDARRAFAVPDRTAEMLRVDLEAAGVPYVTPEGYADLHSLRHTFITRLVMSGCNVKLAQALARHSNPSLTIGTYSHVTLADRATALEAANGTALAPARAVDHDTPSYTAVDANRESRAPAPDCGDGVKPGIVAPSYAFPGPAPAGRRPGLPLCGGGYAKWRRDKDLRLPAEEKTAQATAPRVGYPGFASGWAARAAGAEA